MYSDENKSSALAAILNRFDYVLIDTCSLMDPACPVWMDALHNAKDYRKKKDPIIVPRRCYDELKKHSRDRSVDSRRIAAKRGLKILRKAKWDRLLAVAKKDKNENFADNAIYVKVCADRLFSKILIITQDKSLASDLLALNKLRSQQGRPVEVFKLVNDGKMVPNLGEPRDDRREKWVGGHPKPTPSNNAPTPKPTPKSNQATGVDAVVLADARLSAVLSNGNYPEEKKKADAQNQIKAINALSPKAKASLSLIVPMERLQQIAGTKDKPAPKPELPKKKETPAPKAEKPQKPNGLWYGAGKTMKEAFLDCGKHYGILFRAPAVKYFAGAHGPLDVTTRDLDNVVKTLEEGLKNEAQPSLDLRSAKFIATKVNDTYRCYIDLGKVEKPAAKVEAPKKAEEAPKEVTAKKVEPKPSEAKPGESKPKAKPAKKEAKKAEPKAAAPKKDEAKETSPKPEQAKPKTKAKKVEAKTAEEKPAEVKEKPAKAPRSKANPPKEAPKAEKPQKEVKPAAKKAAKPADETKPAKAKAATKTPLEKALDGDKALVCNLKNPNYPASKKEKALKAQLDLLDKLEEKDLASLKLDKEALEKALAELIA